MLGSWSPRDGFPTTREQWCCFNKDRELAESRNPSPAHPGAKRALAEIFTAEHLSHAKAARGPVGSKTTGPCGLRDRQTRHGGGMAIRGV
ncbi:protein of unknown function [Micropruina glycogenica]|uniref:Uncharacterized protein n=1 Tax=Micropruina glycogenica TaxID=75385 RepID=A0A2N9JCQ7_9ACTN|nr:protein of unknown function [Micropruina glycogenica]